jgi:group II intron reverse transcriptase/maturase
MTDVRQLEAAWERLDRRTAGRARRRGAGVDGVTVEDFSRQAEEEIPRLAEEIRSGRYRARPVRRQYIPKPGSRKKRPLGLPCCRDKVAQEALKSLIEPIFEVEFLDGNHGYRPERSTETACQDLERHLEQGSHWVVDADIRNFFGELDQERLLCEVNRRIADGKILKLIRTFLRAGVMEEMEYRETETGTPQGGVISPLLSNIYLHALDEKLEAGELAWVRYADDLVLLCDSQEKAEAALKRLREFLSEMGLILSEEKTRVVHLSEGFDFLGWHYQGDQRWPRQKSTQGLRSRLRRQTRRNRPGSMAVICQELEPVLRGFFHYYRNGNSGRSFQRTTSWLRHRLRSIQRRREKRAGRATQRDNYRYPNRWFEQCGLLDLVLALRAYRQSNSALSL